MFAMPAEEAAVLKMPLPLLLEEVLAVREAAERAERVIEQDNQVKPIQEEAAEESLTLR
jgi:hypothetical protein